MKPTSTPTAPGEEFPYGWRYVKRALPDGGETLEQVPLTLEDVLHPQPDDQIPQSLGHSRDCQYLWDALESQKLSSLHVFVTSRLIVDWGVPGIRNHAPDIAVFTGLKSRPKGNTNILELASFGGRCELVIEVVQPHTRDTDVVAKFDHYFRVGIPYYVIVDQEEWLGPRELRAYRWTEAGYEAIEADAQGRVFLPPVSLMFGMRDDQVVCFKANGERMLTYSELVQALEIATKRQALAQHLDQLLDDEKRCQEEAQAFGRQIAETVRQMKDLKELDASLRR